MRGEERIQLRELEPEQNLRVLEVSGTRLDHCRDNVGMRPRDTAT